MRILFEGALDVDFIFVPVKSMEKYLVTILLFLFLKRGWKNLIKKNLALRGYRVTACPDGFRALETFENGQADTGVIRQRKNLVE